MSQKKTQSEQPQKMVYKVTPSPRIKRAFKGIMENEAKAKPEPLGKVLRDAGYSKSVSKYPKKVINTTSFQQLLAKQGITDTHLAEKIKEGLDATKPYGKDGDIHPDYSTRHKYIETSLKLKGVQEVQVGGAKTVLNTQINQTNLDPNSNEAKKIINNTLDILMEQTLDQD